MKVIHINSSDVGGAAKACVRLHEGLIEAGFDSQLYVGRFLNGTKRTFEVSKKWQKVNMALSPFIDCLPGLVYKTSNTNFHSYDFWPTGLVDEVVKQKPDVVHIHWIGGGLLRLEELEKIKCPVVWTLHDMWPMAGGEHVDFDTTRIKEGYLRNNRLIGEKGLDIDRCMWNRKRKVFQDLKKIVFVAPSTFMANLAKESAILKDFEIETIPNCLDKNIFKKIDKQIVRNILGLKKDKKYILFGAYSPTRDFNKGFDLLLKALKKIDYKDVELLVFGASSISVNLDIPVKCVGTISDEVGLSLLYNAADLTVVPSRIESFGQVAMESLACGTPVVCFDTGGLKDIVIHNKNGYRAKVGDINDLCAGIKKYLDYDYKISEDKRFDNNLIVRKFINLYKKL